MRAINIAPATVVKNNTPVRKVITGTLSWDPTLFNGLTEHSGSAFERGRSSPHHQ